jgi:para-nitrobenzyl esterase
MAEVTANTRAGRVLGISDSGVRRWLGVPYAKASRFAAPEPVDPWGGSRSAFAMAPQCPQHFFGSAKRARMKPPDFAEDCLALNIWAPETSDGGLRPVLFWIHGGAFIVGSSNTYDGSELARVGDVVVVAINYRLGNLGFVNFGEALGLREIPSNLGLRDQIAALEWVRDNIAAFGGDPNRVTISGESAGSIFVSLLMLCRKAWPLFRRAIMQSGAHSLIHDRERSLKIGRRYAEILDLNQGDLDKLRSLDLRRLFEAQALIDAEQRNGLPAAPWFDGDLLPATVAEAYASATAPVPLIAGSTRDEIRLFEVMPGSMLPVSWPDLEALVRRQLPTDHAEKLLAAYPRSKAGRRALATDLAFGMPTLHFAARHACHNPAWVYRFDYANPLLGAFHAMDLAFLWPMRGLAAWLLTGGPMTGRRRDLAQRVRAHWANFVRDGRPKADWPRYTLETPKVLLFGLEDRIATDPIADRRRAWNGQDVGPGLSTVAAR